MTGNEYDRGDDETFPTIDERLRSVRGAARTRSFRRQLSHKRGQPLSPADVIIRVSYYNRNIRSSLAFLF